MIKKAQLNSDFGEIILDASPYIIGSFKGICQFCIDDPEISPIHTQFSYDENEQTWSVTDMNTRTGTRLNGETIPTNTPVPLQDGNEIGIGNINITFKIGTPEPLFKELEAEQFNDTYETIEKAEDADERHRAGTALEAALLEKINRIRESAGIAETPKPRTAPENVFDNPGDTTAFTPVSEYEENPREAEHQAQDPYSYEQREIKLSNSYEDHIKAPCQDKADQNEAASASEGSIRSRRLGSAKIKPEQPQPSQKPPERQKPRQPECVLEPLDVSLPTMHVKNTPFQIGKADTNDYVLECRGISRHHAEIIRSESFDAFIIRDKGSTNGTYVNDRRIMGEDTRLNKGVIIKFYNCAFRVTQI